MRLLGGRYRLHDRLGAGGMSVVWRGHDEILNRAVAIKLLVVPDAKARARILAEAQAAAGISHPHVTNVYDYGEALDDDGTVMPYIVMELLPGRTLHARLAAGPLVPRVGLRACAEVASALAAAHSVGLVHRDVKPSNIMLTPAGAKVFDFGIAASAGHPELDPDGLIYGTPAYVAPERLTDDVVLAASDVYSLGLLIYRSLTGRLPWTADTTTAMIDARVNIEPARLPYLEDVGPEVNRVYLRCLSVDPYDRPLAADVAAVLSGAAGITMPPVDTATAEYADVAGSVGGPVIPRPRDGVPAERSALVAGDPADGARDRGATGDGWNREPTGTGSDHEPADDGWSRKPVGAGWDRGAGDDGWSRGPADDRPRPGAAETDGRRRHTVRPAASAGESPDDWPPSRSHRRALVLTGLALVAVLTVAATSWSLDNHSPDDHAGSATSVKPSAHRDPTASTSPTGRTTGAPGGTTPAGTTPAAPNTTGAVSATGTQSPGSTPTTKSSRTPRPSHSPTGSPTPTESPVVPVTSVGGKAQVTCIGDQARMLSATPAPGYALSQYHQGPADQVKAMFVKAQFKSLITATCVNGEPVPVVTETTPPH